MTKVKEEHPELFHYTSETGFRGIVESNSLWSTYFDDLNDSNEIKELQQPLASELAVALLPVIKEFRSRGSREERAVSKAGGAIVAAKKLAQDWVSALYSTTFGGDESTRLGVCCITSFCTHAADQDYERENGLLSQWRGYGGAGGFCLVFDTAKLRAMVGEEGNNFFYVYLDLQPAHYFMGGTPVMPLFPELILRSKQSVELAMSGERNFSTAELFLPFITPATTTKHRGFYEEREVRIVAMPATAWADERINKEPGYVSMPLKEVFTTEKDGRNRRHISLFGPERDQLPIKRVIVGPSRNQTANIEIARQIVGEKVLISRSATPFVG